MKRLRLAVPVLGLVLALLPAGALAATHYTEHVDGVETGVPQATTSCPAPWSVSPFAGAATGTIDGVAQIAVCHTPLSPNATIEGGTFSISGSSGTVSGLFAAGGTVTFLGTLSTGGGFCLQQYAVSGGLLPKGSFNGSLTHYGFETAGGCSIFFATITGTAEFTT